MKRERPIQSTRLMAASFLVVAGAGCVGLFLNFHPTLLSGFAWIQGGPVDSRLNHFVLEHTYRWLLRAPHHQDLFAPNLLASTGVMFGFTDVLLGLAPFFWIWRAVGFDPETSYQLWMMTLAALNYLTCFILLHRFLHVGVLGASFGSLIFAFNTAQIGRVMHQHLIPQFYVLSSVMALLVIFGSKANRSVRRAAVVAFFLFWVAQFYSSFYNFFLLGLPFGAALICALLVPTWRRSLARLIREHYLCLLLASLLAIGLCWPLLSVYLSRVESYGYLEQPTAKPKVYIWFLTSHSNLLYGWIRNGPFGYLRGGQFSQGIGLLTSAAACAGIFLFRRNTVIQVILTGFVTTVIATTYLTDTIAFWPYLQRIIPGAMGIRAMCRIGMILLIPAAIGLGLLVNWLGRNRRLSVLGLITVVCLLEQVNIGGRVLSKGALQEEVGKLAGRVDPEAAAFLLVPQGRRPDLAELAYWVALTSGKPTLNIRAVNWHLFSPQADDDALELYLELLKGDDIENVQLIEVEPRLQ